MAYGLKVRDAGGKLIIDTSDRFTRHVYTSPQTASSGNSGALSKLAGLKSGDFSVPVNCGAMETAHTVSRTGNTITWSTFTDVNGLTAATNVIFSFVYT